MKSKNCPGLKNEVFSIAFCAFRCSDSHFHMPSEFISEARKSFFSLPSSTLWLVIIMVAVLVTFHGHRIVTGLKQLSSGENILVMQSSVLCL